MGFLNNLETWYQPNGLANIISFHQLEKHFPITYAWKSKTFVVHTKGFNNEDGMIIFNRSPEGFPYLDLEDKHAFIMINTIRRKLEGYTKQEIKAAHRVYKA